MSLFTLASRFLSDFIATPGSHSTFETLQDLESCYHSEVSRQLNINIQWFYLIGFKTALLSQLGNKLFLPARLSLPILLLPASIPETSNSAPKFHQHQRRWRSFPTLQPSGHIKPWLARDEFIRLFTRCNFWCVGDNTMNCAHEMCCIGLSKEIPWYASFQLNLFRLLVIFDSLSLLFFPFVLELLHAGSFQICLFASSLFLVCYSSLRLTFVL